MAAPTVPDLMFGCWRRSWIKFADGTFDDTSTVIWLQTESHMVDVRINGDRPDMARRSGLRDCGLDELHAIAASDASSGFTECGPPVIGATIPRMGLNSGEFKFASGARGRNGYGRMPVLCRSHECNAVDSSRQP